MKKLDNKLKHQIFGGFSFWTFAMGASLLYNTAIQGIGSLINLTRHNNSKNSIVNSQENSNNQNDNSWALRYNRFGNGSSLMLRFGLRPDKGAMVTTIPIGTY